MDLDTTNVSGSPILKTPSKGKNPTNNPFKPPSKAKDVLFSSDSSSGETSSDDGVDCEPIVRGEAQKWLAEHGQRLFALESSKFLAKQQKTTRRPFSLK